MTCLGMQQWRIWKRDIKQFAEMSRWDDKTVVMNVRLQCDDKLKRVIEAEFGDGWIDLTAEQALTAVEAILRKASNPAREKGKFHKLNQLPGETGKAFVHRCEQQALECNMACPHCNKDISERCIQARNHESEVTGDHMEGREDQILYFRCGVRYVGWLENC